MKLFSFEDWELTQDTLRDVLNYDPKTGEFRWLVKPASRVHIGDRAGSLDRKGYRIIKIATQNHKAHRLAWLYVHGEFPKFGLDHINRRPGSNQIDNLQ